MLRYGNLSFNLEVDKLLEYSVILMHYIFGLLNSFDLMKDFQQQATVTPNAILLINFSCPPVISLSNKCNAPQMSVK
jgi:hypothetical protein